MDKCQRMLWLTVLAMLMSVISGFFFPLKLEEQIELDFADTPLGLLLRPARGIDSNSQTPNRGDPEMMLRRNPCASLGLCMQGSFKLNLFQMLMDFEFAAVATGLSRRCAEEPQCEIGQCNNVNMIRYTNTFSTLFNKVCANAPLFEEGAACWGGPFKSRMTACTISHRPSQPITVENIMPTLVCFAAVPEGIAACSQQDTRLVANTTATMAQVASLMSRA